MTGNEFQEKALRTESSNDSQHLMIEGSLGISGESGEVCDHIKKYLFQGHDLDAKHIAEECGDLLWYVAIMAKSIGYTLDSIMDMNVSKLEERYPHGFEAERSRNRG